MTVTDIREDGAPADETVYAVCEMCGNERVRFVHTMEHEEHERLDVGCVCAEKMSGDYVNPRCHETRLRNRAARRAKWLNRKWKWSSKGNLYLNAEGHNLGIFPDKFHPGKWKYWIGRKFSAARYASSDEAKLALFDEFWKTIEGNDEDDWDA